MFVQENMPNEKKHVVSIRLTNNDRGGIQNLSSRLFIREADLYRFAVNSLLDRMCLLNDDSKRGSDLLPLFINHRTEINQHLNLNKEQLYKIINAGNADPDKLVPMEDIELLFLPDKVLRRQLYQKTEALAFKNKDTDSWLHDYFIDKYKIFAVDDIFLDITQELDS